jgi:acetyl esterase/lipase
LFYCHGGGFVSGIDRVHVPYALRLAEVLHARVVMPDYPLAPEHTWADSHRVLADDLRRRLDDGQRVVIAGDSAGGGLALALAETLRDQGGAQPTELLLLSPWVDLTTSTPDTEALDAVDPWLHLSKLRVYARWWAGSQADLFRPEVSPALGDLDGLPRTLMLCGSRDLLVPGCRLLVDRAAESDWDLTYLEAPGLIHVFPLLPLIPEARVAWRATRDFLLAEPR